MSSTTNEQLLKLIQNKLGTGKVGGYMRGTTGNGLVGGRKRKSGKGLVGGRKRKSGKGVVGGRKSGGLFSAESRANLSSYRQWMEDHKFEYPNFRQRLAAYHAHKGSGLVGGFAKGRKKGQPTKKDYIDQILEDKRDTELCKQKRKNLQKENIEFLDVLGDFYRTEYNKIVKMSKRLAKSKKYKDHDLSRYV